MKDLVRRHAALARGRMQFALNQQKAVAKRAQQIWRKKAGR
jgi:hypothetical protein